MWASDRPSEAVFLEMGQLADMWASPGIGRRAGYPRPKAAQQENELHHVSQKVCRNSLCLDSGSEYERAFLGEVVVHTVVFKLELPVQICRGGTKLRRFFFFETTPTPFI
jgi:hypothetical protein